jgi:transposase
MLAVQAALRHEKATGMSNREIARHCGVDEITVRRWKPDASATLSQMDTSERTAQTSQSETITAIRNGTEYTMKVGNLVKKCAPPLRRR